MFSISKCSTRIYNKQQCSVKHDIRSCIFREGLMMIPSESKHVAQDQ